MQADSFHIFVESNAAYRQILKMAFQRTGLQEGKAHFLEDGDKALDYLGAVGKAGAPTPLPIFILLSLELPGHSGFDILAWIKAHERLRAVPVIVSSVCDDPRAVSKAYAYGANSYLVKPSNFEELVGMITALMTYWSGFNQSAEPTVRFRG